MSRIPRSKNSDENNEAAISQEESCDEEGGEGWWEAGKKGKQSKKVRFVCKGGDEPCDKVIGVKEKSIQCEACLDWFHPKCQDLCAEAFNAIDAYKLLWICNVCRKRLVGMLDMGRRVEACIERAEKRISQAVLKAKQETAEEMGRKVQGQLMKMEEHVTKQIDSTSETLKKTVQNQEQIVERSNNLIIHGLKDDVKKDARQQKEDDREKIVEITKAVCGEGADLRISEVIRLRRNSDQNLRNEKPALLLVKFERKEDANKLFQRRMGLKDAGYPNIYINRDLSKEEREKQYKLREELKKKGRESHRIFRGKVVPRDQ